MARIRTIKPEFWVDDQMVELDYPTRLLFIGLWNFVDDDGYIEYKAKRIKMQIFPADDFDVSGGLRKLLEISRIEQFTSDQGLLLKVTNWERHQRVSHATATRFTGISAVPYVNTPEDSGALANVPERSALNGIEGNGKEGNRTEDVTLSRPEVSRLCDVLADGIEGNGSPRPNVTKSWQDSARLMIDNDHRPVAEALALIQWCQSDSFWRANILSMPKFRDKYDTLRLQRETKQTNHRKQTPEERALATLSLSTEYMTPVKEIAS